MRHKTACMKFEKFEGSSFFTSKVTAFSERYPSQFLYELHIPPAETIKKLDNFILKGVDLQNHTEVLL